MRHAKNAGEEAPARPHAGAQGPWVVGTGRAVGRVSCLRTCAHLLLDALLDAQALALLGGHRRVGLLAAPLVGGRPVLVVRCRHVLEAQTLKKREAFPCTQWAARLRADPLANLQLRVLVVHKVFFVADVRLRER